MLNDIEINKRYSISGFSLVEMAMVVLISGILLSSITHSYSIYLETRRVNVTYDRMDKIKNALHRFYEVQGRYPCPANPSDVMSGLENCDSSSFEALGDVENGRVKIVSGRDNNKVLIGSIPYETIRLGLYDSNPYDNQLGDTAYVEEDSTEYEYISSNEYTTRYDISDDWGRQITYIVTQDLTNQATYDYKKAAIAVETEPVSPNPSGQSMVEPAGTAAWVILSHGENGVGAYLNNGEKYYRQDCIGLEALKNNCNFSNDITIISALTNKVIGSDYFDDIVFFSQAQGRGFWDSARKDPEGSGSMSSRDIYNKNIGFVGIGTKEPVHRLDIAGSLKSDKLVTKSEICNTTGTVCISPHGFLSAGCNGRLIKGINKDGLVCEAFTALPAKDLTPARDVGGCINNEGDVDACAAASGRCNAGFYALGISAAGKIICGRP